MNRFLLLVFPLIAGMLSLCNCSSIEVDGLTCEMLTNPLAIDSTHPHFSWQMSGRKEGVSPAAYQILVATDPDRLNEGDADLWNSGKVMSSKSLFIPYDGNQLTSLSYAYWKVRVWDQEGKCSAWSAPAFFGVGILEEEDWSPEASFIGVTHTDDASEIAPLLRTDFQYERKADRILLHVNSLGYHEAYVNGDAVSEGVLNPAVSQFGARSRIITYDVTPYVRRGRNELVIWLGKGWYQTHTKAVIPGGPYVRAELDAVTSTGVETLAATGSDWKYAESGRRTFGTWHPHQMGGEIVDSRVPLHDLKPSTLDGLEWMDVITAEIPVHKATPQMCELNKVTDRIHPIEVFKTDEDSYIYDMGTSFVGFTEVMMPVVDDGKVIDLYYEDMCIKDMKSFRDKVYYDQYIGNGKTEGIFTSKFNYKGYRYLKIKGLKEPVPLDAITGSKIRTGYSVGSSFECSDNDLNAIYDMIHNTCHALTLGGYMVDCPQIERLGYGGDGNASTPTLQILGNMAPLYMNWMQAWGDSQREDGGLPHTAPNPYMAGGGPFWCEFIIAASWQTYLNYGDRRLMERYYPNMVKWIEYAENHCVDGLLKDWGTTDYRWWYLGDWASPVGIVDMTDPRSVDIVSNCVLSDSYYLMSKIAGVLGRDDDEKTYMEKHIRHNELIHRVFYDPSNSTYASGSQIDMIYPMLVGATPEICIDDVVKTLYDLTQEKYNGHLCTGLVGIPVMTQWSVREGQADFIYKMLKKKEYPGYLHMIELGATLTWETWEGDRSQIHNCYNGIGAWFYQALAGILPDENNPGYGHVIIRPQMIEGVDWVRAEQYTPYGNLGVRWEKKNGSFYMNVTVPVGCSATIYLPDGTIRNVTSGTYDI